MSSKPLELSFFCVQPVAFNANMAEKIYTAPPFSPESGQSFGHEPFWLEYFKKYYNSFDYIVPVNGIDDRLVRLEQELNEKSHSLAAFLNSQKTRSYLLFDSRFNYFIIMYEFVMNISFEQIVLWNEKNYDLYNDVRNLFVKSDNRSNISSCVEEGQKDYIEYIQNYISKMIDGSINENQVFIQKDTGNMTSIVQAPLSEREYEKLVEIFRNFNQKGERIGTPEFFKINHSDFLLTEGFTV